MQGHDEQACPRSHRRARRQRLSRSSSSTPCSSSARSAAIRACCPTSFPTPSRNPPNSISSPSCWPCSSRKAAASSSSRSSPPCSRSSRRIWLGKKSPTSNSPAPPRTAANSSRISKPEKSPLFLISLKAGGTGLNLTAADTVIHYDPWWNPAAEAQATDRAYRIGQDKPVFVHKLLCQDTVEERIHKLQQDKAKLAAGLLADADITNKLDPAMVRALLEE